MPNYDPGYPPEYDFDPIEWAEKEIKNIKYCLLNWDDQPSPAWQKNIQRLIMIGEELIKFIEENV